MIQAIDFPIILFDGTSVSNPGAAAAASVILLPNGRRYTVSQFLSLATDQEAIYTGLIIGLRKAKQLGLRRLEIKGENDLIFNQVNKLVPVTDRSLQKLYLETMAVRKVQIDYPKSESENEKLPWEGELSIPRPRDSVAMEMSEPFFSDEPIESSLPLSPLSIESLALSISLKETLINFPFPAINRGIPETIAEDQEDDPSKDTLPSRDKVAIILEMIESLSVEETHSLVQEMVKSPELVNFVLKAIASQISSNK